MKKLALLLIIGSTFLSCKSEPKSSVKEISWLEGKWTAIVQGNNVQEQWTLVGDSIWKGESIFVREGETLFTEMMTIALKDGKFLFVTAISDQNEGDDIIFKETERTATKIVFENPKHDFPQVITYETSGKDKLKAYISGKLNGEAQRIDFDFRRMI